MVTRCNFTTEDVLEAVLQDQESEFEEEFSDEVLSDPEGVPEVSMSDSGGESALEDKNDTDTAHAPISSSGRGRARNSWLPHSIFRLNWEVYDDFDPFESDWLPKYQRPHGILVDTHKFKPVDYFSLFFPDEAFTLMVEETNRYAIQYLDSTRDLPQNSRFHKWYDTSVKEMIRPNFPFRLLLGYARNPP